MNDKEIIELFFKRSETAVTELNEKYGAYLNTIAGNILRDSSDVEEIVNDTYLAVWDLIPPEEPKVLRHYLSRIIRNLALKKVEQLSAAKRSGEVVNSLDELSECIPDACSDVESEVEAKELGAEINLWLGTLSKEDQAVFVSRYYYVLSTREIAEKYSMPERRVKYRLSVMRKELKERLKKEGLR